MEEIKNLAITDDYQEQIQNSQGLEEEKEYLNNHSEVVDVNNQTDNRFKCSFKDCEEHYNDEECMECKDNGQPDKCFCLKHSAHDTHKSLEENIRIIQKKKTTKNLKQRTLNTIYVFNLLKCIVEVRTYHN